MEERYFYGRGISQWILLLFDDPQFSGMDLNTVLDLNLMGWPGRFACRLDNLQVLPANLVFAVL